MTERHPAQYRETSTTTDNRTVSPQQARDPRVEPEHRLVATDEIDGAEPARLSAHLNRAAPPLPRAARVLTRLAA